MALRHKPDCAPAAAEPVGSLRISGSAPIRRMRSSLWHLSEAPKQLPPCKMAIREPGPIAEPRDGSPVVQTIPGPIGILSDITYETELGQRYHTQ